MLLKRLALALLLLFTYLPGWAARQLPLPAKLMQSKTVCIDNRSGYAAIGDRAHDKVKKWGRFQVIDDKNKAHCTLRDPQKADLVFLLTAKESPTGYRNSYVLETYLTVIDPTTEVSLWAPTPALIEGKRRRRWGIILVWDSASRALGELRKRIQEQESAKAGAK